MGNIVTSMRRMAEPDWTKVFEAMSLAKARLRQAPGYGFRDPQRLPQRHRGLARGLRPADVAASELRLAGAACQASPDTGRVLIGPQRQAFETTQGFRPGLGLRLCRLRFGLTGCFGAVSGPCAWRGAVFRAFGLCRGGCRAGADPSGGRASGRSAPELSLRSGIPEDCRTLVAVPVLLTGPQDLTRMLRRLEVHHLSSIGGAVHDALLSDGPESGTGVTATDRALISKAQAGIAALNAT